MALLHAPHGPTSGEKTVGEHVLCFGAVLAVLALIAFALQFVLHAL